MWTLHKLAKQIKPSLVRNRTQPIPIQFLRSRNARKFAHEARMLMWLWFARSNPHAAFVCICECICGGDCVCEVVDQLLVWNLVHCELICSGSWVLHQSVIESSKLSFEQCVRFDLPQLFNLECNKCVGICLSTVSPVLSLNSKRLHEYYCISKCTDLKSIFVLFLCWSI